VKLRGLIITLFEFFFIRYKKPGLEQCVIWAKTWLVSLRKIIGKQSNLRAIFLLKGTEIDNSKVI
jgi:hypothetical protein